MATHETYGPSHEDDSETFRKGIPFVGPLAAVVLSTLIFVIAAAVLSQL